MCLRCVQMFSDVQRCFQVFTDVLGCWMEILFLMIFDSLKVLSNESMDFNDPKEFDDPQVFDGRKFQLEVWNLIIQKSTVIPPSSLVLFSFTIDPPNNKCHTIVVCLMAMFVILLLFHCYAESLTSTQRHRIICISIQSSMMANTFKSLTMHNLYYLRVDFFW